MTLIILFVIAICVLMPRSVATAFKAIKNLDKEIDESYKREQLEHHNRDNK